MKTTGHLALDASGKVIAGTMAKSKKAANKKAKSNKQESITKSCYAALLKLQNR